MVSAVVVVAAAAVVVVVVVVLLLLACFDCLVAQERMSPKLSGFAAPQRGWRKRKMGCGQNGQLVARESHSGEK